MFVGAFIYDVLCGFFYFAALAYYIHFREKEAYLRPLQLLGFLALYICALNCKEMAVTLPVIVLVYEFLNSPSWLDWKAFLRWIRFYAAPSLIAGLLTVFYIYGKTHGSGSLASLDPYQPKYSWHNFTASNAKFVGQLLFAGQTITPTALLLLWALGPHTSANGILDSDRAPSPRIYRPRSRRRASLPSALRVGNDLRKGCL